MTIKEKIFYIIGVLTFGGNIQESEIEQAFKILDEIQKDLEVLAIIKNHITIDENDIWVIGDKYYFYGDEVSKEEYEIIKRWLENE